MTHSELTRGTHLHCSLYNGMDAYVLSTTEGDKGFRSVGGGASIILPAKVNLVYASPAVSLASIGETIIRGPQWRIGTEPALNERELSRLEALAAYNVTDHKAERLRLDRQDRAWEVAGAEIMTHIDQHSGDKPPKAAIIAYFDEDQSDSQSDYFASRRKETWVVGLSGHQRQLFPEMRKIADGTINRLSEAEQAKELRAAMTRLAEQNPKFEHRENYSMGAGTFLSDKEYGSRWKMVKWARSNFFDEKIHKILGQGSFIAGDNEPLRMAVAGALEKHGLLGELALFVAANDKTGLLAERFNLPALAGNKQAVISGPEEDGEDDGPGMGP